MTRIAISLVALIGLATPAFAQFRTVDDPSLPSADRIAPWIRQKLGDHASADVRLCIAGDGHVTSISLVHTSSYEAFDRAVLKDVSSWRFEATGDSRCAKTTISYDASAH